MDKGTFLTSDLGEAAYIVTVGYPVLDIRPAKDDPPRLEFVFGGKAEEVGKAYYRGATVEAQRFMMTQKELKGRLFRARR